MSFRGIVLTASVAFCLIVWFGVYQMVFADGLKNAGVMAVDRLECGITISQDKVNLEIIRGMIEYDVNYSEALTISANYGTILIDELRKRGVSKEYCNIRKGS